MSITVELPPDIEEQVRNIPDLNQRVLSFLRNQVDYEKWRTQRYSERAGASSAKACLKRTN